MAYLSGKLPGVGEVGQCRWLTHGDPAPCTAIPEAPPVRNAPVLRKSDPQLGMLHREPAVVGTNGERGLSYPLQQSLLGQIKLVRFQRNVDCGVSYFKAHRRVRRV